MTYELETKKVDLSNGHHWNPLSKKDYAIFYVELRHGTQKAVNVLTRPFLEYPDKPPKLIIEGEDKVTVQGSQRADIDLTKVDMDEVNDVMIVGQVKEWSFGLVDQATLDGIPETIRKRLLDECNLLYAGAGPLTRGGDGN